VVAALVLFLLSVRRFKAAGTPLPGNKPTLGRYGVEPGQTVKVTTRRGSIELTARADRYVQEGTIFIPFAYVEAAANVLTDTVAMQEFVDVEERDGEWFATIQGGLKHGANRRLAGEDSEEGNVLVKPGTRGFE
jgi:molybdopterin biosynthesis enzyme